MCGVGYEIRSQDILSLNLVGDPDILSYEKSRFDVSRHKIGQYLLPCGDALKGF